ncbi:lipopolysaccharide biosynthesis protein [Macrococcus equi]|uniref:lipopolysaccharide biosynthesis protein n=1 Tax=Macrococcus equi TaxID=3395462 RepID=UPI0039BE318C
MKSKKVDFLYSILSSVLPLIVIQLLLIPLYSHHVTKHEFGIFLLVITIINMTTVILGNTLNNIRLTDKDEINEYEYLMYLFLLSLVQIIISLIVCIFFKLSLSVGLNIIFWSVALMFKTYFLVYFRVVINYKDYLISSIINAVTLFLGVLMLYVIKIDIFLIYAIAEILTLLFVVTKVRHYFKNYRLVIISKQKRRNFQSLLSANIISNLILYSDRILIGSILGAAFVPYFFIATTIGKMSNLIINPIANVLLSYNVKENNKINIKNELKNFIKLILITLVFSIVIYFCSLIFIKYFYSQYYEATKQILWISNFAVLLLSITSIPQMKLIGNNKYRSNLNINVIILVLLAVTSPMIYFFGLLGYSYCLILISLIKYLLILKTLSKH